MDRGLWQAVLGDLEVSISRANFATWFKHTSVIANDNGYVTVAVPNIFTKEWLEKKYDADIRGALGRVCDDFKGVTYTVKSQLTARPEPMLAESLLMATKSAPAVTAIAAPSSEEAGPGMNPKYTFDSFVVGSSNELA